MTFLLPFILSAPPFAAVAQPPLPSGQPPADAPSPKTTEVMVVFTAKEGVTNLVAHEDIPVGPLMPLTALIAF
jgi:hypothetical protein